MTPSKRSAAPLSRPPAEGPIADFIAVIEGTPTDSWQKRTQSFQQLVDQIPTGAHYSETPLSWYNNPPTLRHLAIPISALLKDARSTVVKRTCASLTQLFQRCQTEARYLLKDIMPTILSVHAQTVQVIRTAVQNMVLECLPEVPCKMIMPLWMERLKMDKSRTVREACVVYLRVALQSWTEESYLTHEIWNQVGTVLLQSVRDPSPTVRAEAKSALKYMKQEQPLVFEELVSEETDNAPIAQDPKLKRWIKSLDNADQQHTDEELSVASKWSYNHDIRNHQGNTTPSSKSRLPPHQSRTPTGKSSGIPSDIHVSHSTLTERSGNRGAAGSSGTYPLPRATTKKTVGLGPPMRRTFSKEDDPSPRNIEEEMVHESTSFPDEIGTFDSRRNGGSLRGTSSDDVSPPPPPPPPHPSNNSNVFYPIESVATGSSSKPIELAQSPPPIVAKQSDGGGSTSPFIGSMSDLRKHASLRRSRNSMLMQERFRLSLSIGASGSLDEMDEDVGYAPHASSREPVVQAPLSPSGAPEHMVIAVRLLKAHKDHVDSIMETLRMEMDVLRDFDKLLEEPGRPMEEEVLNYFESVGLCLDQRTQAGLTLQSEMDMISRGEPPEE